MPVVLDMLRSQKSRQSSSHFKSTESRIPKKHKSQGTKILWTVIITAVITVHTKVKTAQLGMLNAMWANRKVNFGN